jgi:hypothetical protein
MTNYNSFDNYESHLDEQLFEYRNHAHISTTDKRNIRKSCLNYIILCVIFLMFQIIFIGHNCYAISVIYEINNVTISYKDIRILFQVIFLILQLYDMITLIFAFLFIYSIYINMSASSNLEVNHLNIVKKYYWIIKITISDTNLVIRFIITLISFLLFMIITIKSCFEGVTKPDVLKNITDYIYIINYGYIFASCFIIYSCAYIIEVILHKI